MIFDKIKKIFIKNDNPCYYTHVTKNHKAKIFIHDKLNKNEKENNKNALIITKIVTIEHGKKLFVRFLKMNDFYASYIKYIKIGNIDFDEIIRTKFVTPFRNVFTYGCEISETDKNKIQEIEKKWIKLLESIKFIH